ncbi:DUF6171 family protein [Paenibacillus tarimensis]|uniref:DUF6171 family protein n=1 Tax=Paenibacillus tarimensis TaxID=416012 RepID=UPI001F26E74C|nr:DUF6171 family protein [Paenibacillus tarimensis]MCF2944857.1 DUF6171 family protein [Paenibacillus tarimensis]
MERTDGCKGCSRDVQVSEAQIEAMVNKLDSRGFDCVSDDVYEQRLASCSSCESLSFGHTCKFCGCIVRVRAKLADKTCPNPAGSRWQ